MVAQHYRWDFIGLSTDTKPTPATSEKVVDGSTFYCSDNSKLYVFYKDTWYEKTVSGGGGGTTVVQTTGTSETDVMSQKAVSSTIFNDPATKKQIKIGDSAVSNSTESVAIGYRARANNNSNVAIGSGAYASETSGICIGGSTVASGKFDISIGASAQSSQLASTAIGSAAKAAYKGSVVFTGGEDSAGGQFQVGTNKTGWTGLGYNDTDYRLITGVYDGQGAHDAVTVGQINNLIDAINAAANLNLNHIGS